MENSATKPPKGNSEVKKLRILFVPWDRFPPFRPAARAIFLNQLPRNGHRIDWLIQADDLEPKPSVKAIESGFVYIGATDPGRKFYNRVHKHFLNLKNSFRILTLARSNHYDLIQAKDNFFAALIGLLAARLQKIRFFYWVAYPRAESSIYEGRSGIARYPFIYWTRGYLFKFLLYKVIAPASDHIFVQSSKMKSDMHDEGVPLSKMTPVPSSVDLEAIPFESVAESRHLISKGQRKWVVYLGTLKRVRKLDFMIRAFANVLKSVPDATLIVIGKGDRDSDLFDLQQVAKQCGLESSVLFTGHLDMADGWEYIRHADVCLSPYFPTQILLSTSPTKLVEYMAMGRPVVANDHPEQTQVIEESKAGICVQWDEEAFAKAIVSLLTDSDRAERMGRCGRRYVEKYRTNKAMGEVVEEAYWSILRSDTDL